MNMIKNPLTLSAAALALVLAGCGGSDDPPTNTQEMEEETSTETTHTTPPSSVSAANSLRTATSTLATLAGPVSADGSALKMAMTNDGNADNLLKAQGVSGDIMESAQGVLVARTALVNAVEAAKTAKTAAEGALASATGATKENLEDAIKAADAAIKAGEAVLADKGRNSLQAYVNQYSGEGKTPAEKASAAAESVFDALATDPTEGASFPDKDVFARGNSRTSAMMTFAEIFAGKTERISSSNSFLVATKVFEGAADTNADILSSGDSSEADLMGFGNVASVRYLGILGTAYCRTSDGAACTGDTEDASKVWYFAPTSSDAYYVASKGDNAGYEAAKYVEWGMWLTGDTPTLNQRIDRSTVGGPVAAAITTGSTDENGLTKTATYKGGAAGLSARKHGTGDDERFASGHFEADVELTAKFGDSATLKGKIDNFRAADGQGTDHVADWTLNLVEGNVSSGSISAGTYDRSSLGGGWTAEAYGGSATARPDGFTGTFDVDNADAKIQGVYHTPKQ